MSEVANFLLARITEGERRATTLRFPQGVTISKTGLDDDGVKWNGEWITDEECRSRCEPVTDARVLADCEAKRRIVEECVDRMDSGADEDGNLMTSGAHLGELVLRHLALPYADHPDYREEWRP